MARSKSRIPDKCSSMRTLSSPGSDFSSVKASARTASRMLRFRVFSLGLLGELLAREGRDPLGELVAAHRG